MQTASRLPKRGPDKFRASQVAPARRRLTTVCQWESLKPPVYGVRDVTQAATSAGLAAGGDDTSQKGTTFAQAVFSVLNITCGVGLLSVPLCFSKSGYAGVVVLWILGIIAAYTAKSLCRCSKTVAKQLNKKPGEMVRYEEIAEAALGGKEVAAKSGTQMGTLQMLLGTHAGIFWVCAMVVVPSVLAPNVKALAVLGLAGFAATMTVTAAVAYTLLTGDFVSGASTVAVNWASMPLVYGILAFCYSGMDLVRAHAFVSKTLPKVTSCSAWCLDAVHRWRLSPPCRRAGHSVFPSVQDAMESPHDFPAVLNVSFAIVATLCSFLGLAGYYMYGSGVLDVVTFNMHAGKLKTVCAAMILVNPIAKFAITQEPVALAVRAAVSARLSIKETYWFRSVINVMVASCIVAVARFLPYLSIVMSLVGAFMTISISFILPAAANFSLHRHQMSASEKAWAILVVCVGVICTVSGTFTALQALQSALAA